MNQRSGKQRVREEAERQVAVARKSLSVVLRKQRAESKEASSELSRLRTLAKRETKLSASVLAGMAERGEKTILELIQMASDREVHARLAVRKTERKIAELGSEKDMERRVRLLLKTGRSRERGVVNEQVERMEAKMLFYLNLAWVNLFESTRNPLVHRCKGCGVEVKTWLREQHFNAHKKEEESVTKEGSTTKTTTARGGRATRAEIPASVEKQIIDKIESGKHPKTVADELNASKVEHPSGTWTADRAQRVYMKAAGIAGNREAWKKVVAKYGLKASPDKKEAPAARTRRLPSATSKSSAAKKKTTATAKKATAARKTAAATPKAESKTKTATSKKPAGARDLAKKDVVPDPKPPKREKASRGR